MRIVYRTAVTLKPKQPFVDWINSLEDDFTITAEELMEDRNVYLIPESGNKIPFTVEKVLPSYFKSIFEEELGSWYLDESVWPQQRGFSTFLKWFEVDLHSMVLDITGDHFIPTEDYDE